MNTINDYFPASQTSNYAQRTGSYAEAVGIRWAVFNAKEMILGHHIIYTVDLSSMEGGEAVIQFFIEYQPINDRLRVMYVGKEENAPDSDFYELPCSGIEEACHLVNLLVKSRSDLFLTSEFHAAQPITLELI